jgi:hypothetical protein
MSELWKRQLDPNDNESNRLFKGLVFGFIISALFWIPLWILIWNWLDK